MIRIPTLSKWLMKFIGNFTPQYYLILYIYIICRHKEEKQENTKHTTRVNFMWNDATKIAGAISCQFQCIFSIAHTQNRCSFNRHSIYSVDMYVYSMYSTQTSGTNMSFVTILRCFCCCCCFAEKQAISNVGGIHHIEKYLIDYWLLIFRRNAQYSVSSTIHAYQHHAAVAATAATAVTAAVPSPPSSANANSMQLMPYTAQTKTLNPDELSKLYSMNQYNRPMVPSNMLNFPTVHTSIGLGQPQIQAPNIANQMSLAQANTNTAQFLPSTPYLPQGKTERYLFIALILQISSDK